jgi:hypothetical protein
MKKEDRRKLRNIILISTVLLVLGNSQGIMAEEDYLIVRIVKADYPPDIYVDEEYNLTFFAFTVYYEIENPTQSTIYMDYICSPIPFPWLETNLVNKNISASIGLGVEWVGGTYGYSPGIHEGNYDFTIEFEPYASEILPQGEYFLWFNFTDCCSVNVPVAVEKMHINSLENQIIYTYYHDNSTEVFDYPKPTNTTNETSTMNMVVPFFLAILLVRKRRKLRLTK